MSHTISVKVEIKDKHALAAAVERLGGRVLGEGTHALYQGSVQGFGLILPDWKYPIVLDEAGNLAYDDYGGRWGDAADIQRLTDGYAIEAAVSAAQSQGWYVERHDDRAIVYHPDGGTLTVTADGVTASGFSGGGCQQPTELLGAAMGGGQGQHLPEFYERHNQVQCRS